MPAYEATRAAAQGIFTLWGRGHGYPGGVVMERASENSRKGALGGRDFFLISKRAGVRKSGGEFRVLPKIKNVKTSKAPSKLLLAAAPVERKDRTKTLPSTKTIEKKC